MSRALSNPVILASPEKGLDGRTTLAKARPPMIVDGRIGDFWIDTQAKKLYGPKNASGWPDNGLIRGPQGWAPKLVAEADGVRRLFKIADWTGGEGEKPAVGYLALDGSVVARKADAGDFRGAEGPQALIGALQAAPAPVTDETMTATGAQNEDNVRREIVEVFDLGGDLPRRSVAHAKASRIRSGVSSVTVAGFAAAGDGGGARYRRVDREPGHGAKFRSTDRFLSGGEVDFAHGGWWEISSEIINERQTGAVAGAQDGALVALVARGKVEREAELIGDVSIAVDLPNIHDIAWRGPGSIKIGTGPKFFVCPSRRNRGFGDLGFNTIFVSSDGSSTASGLSPEYPVSVTRARDILARYGGDGTWRLQFASGVYRESLVLWDIVRRSLPLYLTGPAVEAWNNIAPPPEPVAISAITSTVNPIVTTATAHGLASGDEVFLGLARRAGGAHGADGAVYVVDRVSDTQVRLAGVDGSGWAAYTGSGKLWALKGSRPKAIFYGTGDANAVAWTLDNIRADINDFLFVGWGGRNITGQAAAIRTRRGADVRHFNVHAWECTRAGFNRDASIVSWRSGEIGDCRQAFHAIDARVDYGLANPATVLNDTPLVKRCGWVVDMWEMSSGHADGMRLVDNQVDLQVRKNAHLVGIKNEITNSGAAKPSVFVDDGGYFTGSNDNTWIGSFRPRVLRRSNASSDRTEAAFDWVTVLRLTPAAIPAGGGERTLGQIDLPQTAMSFNGQAFRMRTWGLLNAMAGGLVVRIKRGATVLYSRNFLAASSPRHFDIEFEGAANGFDTVRGRWRHTIDDAGSNFETRVVNTSFALNTMNEGGSLAITFEPLNAADTVPAFGFLQIEASGW